MDIDPPSTNPIEALAQDIVHRLARAAATADTLSELAGAISAEDIAVDIATLLVDLLPDGSEAPEAAARLIKG